MTYPVTSDLLLQLLNKFGVTMGAELNAYIGERETAVLEAVETKLSVLRGEDARVNAFLQSCERLLDAEPGTEGFQEGQNLVTFITDKIGAAHASIEAVESDVIAQQRLIDTMAQSFTSLADRVLSLENLNLTYDQALVTVNDKLEQLRRVLETAASNIELVSSNFREALRGLGGPRGTPTTLRPGSYTPAV